MVSDGGYQVTWQDIRRRSARADADAGVLREQRENLRQGFDEVGNPLGDDQYGAELERNLPAVRESLFASFDAYIAQVEYLRDGLWNTSRTYEYAEELTSYEPAPDDR
ncbi:hypothetical protein FAF44_11400 [Nonomuraea sp. MG754425]|uniref:hypothetical protein n=1 Tax=Nonomuraea sp. MG754425 TaxID=2570319 RepID=UPI001F1B9B7E|nr:hypothetical protein [Nonomuraea sp. MG754425]MCF6468989.1 hypothetical protein [Nonomuraea sp. MG754425]